MSKSRSCDACNGSGWRKGIHRDVPCAWCNATGRIMQD